MIKKITLLVLCTILSFSLFAQEQKVIRCSSHEHYMEEMANDPEFAKNQLKLEQDFKAYLDNFPTEKRGSQTVKIIPIVFHIFHTYGAENIPKERVLEQIEILNKDFRRLNADTNETNPLFKALAVDCGLEFRLAQIDPNGQCTDGIVRMFSPLTFNASNNVKSLSAWPNNQYFNIWVVETIEPSSGTPTGGVVLGRSQFPGGSNLTDGILLKAQVCGNTTNFNNYGRTLTHEMGHSFNLRHIWGDQDCGSDGVDDTPVHFTSNDGCPINKTNTCLGSVTIEMTENYMDYTDGVCQNMFSFDQNERMQFIVNGSTNGRNNLWTQANLVATGTDSDHVAQLCLPKADFYSNRVGCVGSSVTFNDASWRGQADSWKWTFENGTPGTSTDQNPSVSYTTPGVYKVKLVASNATGSDSTERSGYITIMDANLSEPFPYSEGIEDTATIGTNLFTVSDDALTWVRTTNAAYTGSASLMLKAYGTASGKYDAFFLPALDLTGVTGATLKFKLAYARRNASTAEELRVGISRNCGGTYFMKYTKSGDALATTSNVLTNFTPTSTSQWREESVSLANIQNFKGGIVRFEAITGGGNNIYIDDIEITGTTGVNDILYNNLNMNVTPNPFTTDAKVKFFLTSDASVSLKVYDLLGKELAVITQGDLRFGEHSYEINTSNSGITDSGIYFVKLSVNGFEKVQKIVLAK